MEEGRDELDFWRRAGVVVLEDHLALVEPALPGRPLLPGDGVLPQHQVHRTVRVLHRPCNVSISTHKGDLC